MEKVILEISFDVENSAFRTFTGNGPDMAAVTSKIKQTVKDVEKKLQTMQYDEINGTKIKDLNGNTIGRVKFKYPDKLPTY